MGTVAMNGSQGVKLPRDRCSVGPSGALIDINTSRPQTSDCPLGTETDGQHFDPLLTLRALRGL
jgi:hypothetical protein